MHSIGSISMQKKSSTWKIAIPKSKVLMICLFVLLYVYFIGFFTYNLGVPETAYYLTDVLLVLCLLMCPNKALRTFKEKRLKLFSTLLMILILVGLASAMINGFKPILWLWSLRNWGRFFLYFFLCVALLNERWIDRMLSMTVNVFLINIVVIFLQYMLLGMRGDALNGLVGRNTSGANIVLTMAAAIIVSAEYINKKCTIRKLVIVFAGVMVVSILAELKAIILFAVFIFGLMFLVNSNFTAKQVLKFLCLAILAIAAVFFGLRSLARVYPEFAKFMSMQGFINAVTTEGGYGNTGYIDRLTAVRVINKYLFSNTTQHFIGIGMGNAEYSTAAILTSAFYNAYGATFRYLGFSVSMLYLEGGYIGFGLYISLFVVLIIQMFRKINKNKKNSLYRPLCFYESIGFGMAILALIFIWYNNLARTDMSVLMAFYMAIPFALTRKGAKSINGIIY